MFLNFFLANQNIINHKFTNDIKLISLKEYLIKFLVIYVLIKIHDSQMNLFLKTFDNFLKNYFEILN